jgi:hypothetical protein
MRPGTQSRQGWRKAVKHRFVTRGASATRQSHYI